MSNKYAKPEIRTLNHAPGFECPVCQKVKIQVSLENFLGNSEVVCPLCSTRFDMDKSQCAPLMEMLQKLNIAHQNVRLLKGRSA